MSPLLNWLTPIFTRSEFEREFKMGNEGVVEHNHIFIWTDNYMWAERVNCGKVTVKCRSITVIWHEAHLAMKIQELFSWSE